MHCKTYLLLCFTFLVTRGQLFSNCTAIYNSAAVLCPTTPTNCTVNSLTSLLVNSTDTNQYVLCIQLAQDLYLVDLNDTILGSIGIAATNIYFSSSILTLVVPEGDNSSSLFSAANTLSFNSTNITSDYLTAMGQTVSLTTNSQFESFVQFNISATLTFSMSASQLEVMQLVVQSGATTLSSSALILVNGQSMLIAQGTILVSANSGIVSTLNQCDSLCSCSGEGTENCTEGPPLSFPLAWSGTNFSLPSSVQSLIQVIDAFNISIIATTLEITNSSIQASAVGIYTNTTIISAQGNISAQGLGCRSKTGLGCGYYDVTLNQLLACSGTGGSYGGLGGSSAPDTCTLLAPRRTYGSVVFPTNKGSGGGNPLTNNLSSGGGLIVIQTYMLSIDSTSEINADGLGGLYGGGGGSGGSINVQTAYVSGKGEISAMGGVGKSSGGGGRISLQLMMWLNGSIVQPQSSLVLTVGASVSRVASSLSSGLNGSIFTMPCLPGQYMVNQYLCVNCPNGTFKPTFGYSNCSNCPQPRNSTFLSNLSGWTALSQCINYNCTEGYTQIDGVCLNGYEKVVQTIGGENVVICIMMIIGSLVMYGLIVLCHKIIKKKDSLSPQLQQTDDNLRQFAQKPLFQIEELPYHEYRIYLSGSNCMKDPWRLSRDSLQNIRHRFLNSQRFQQLAKQIDKLGEYPWWSKAIYYFLYGFYFPFAFCFETRLKETKSANLSKLIKRFQKDTNWAEVTIKANVKSNNTVACLEIFNYQRSLYDFCLENCFPLVFVLEKRPLGGYMLDFSDPFLKAMMLYRAGKSTDEPNYGNFEKYCTDLNELLLKIPDMDPVITHLAAADEYGVQLFLLQPPNNILNFYPKESFTAEKELVLVLVEEKTVSEHFYISSALPNFKTMEMERLKWQLAKKQEQKTQLCTLPFFRPTKVRKIVWIWMLGITNILELIIQAILFYDVITILRSDTPGCFPYFYFIIFPLAEFVCCGTLFAWCLKPTFQMGVYSMLFSLANLAKSFILGVVFVIILIAATAGAPDSQLGIFIVISIGLMFVMVLMQRPFLWSCRNS